jgi:hypothetical protein
METKGQTISRVRALVKGAKADAFLTDRLIYSMVLKFARTYIKRKDDAFKIGRNSSLFQKLPGVPLIEVSKIEAGCIDIEMCCNIMRTEEKLPVMFEGGLGPLIRSITSIDGSKQVYITTARLYAQLSRSSYFKYNKSLYVWFQDGHLYFPNVTWPVVDVEAMFENDISQYKCDADDCCVDRRTEKCFIPDDLFTDIEEPLRQALLNVVQIPKDNMNDKQNLLR